MEDLQADSSKSLDLGGALVEMFKPKKDEQVQRVGEDVILIKETIYDFAGKTDKQIYDIMLLKIKNWERIHEEFDYEGGEQRFNSTGGIDLVFKFVKRKI